MRDLNDHAQCGTLPLSDSLAWPVVVKNVCVCVVNVRAPEVMRLVHLKLFATVRPSLAAWSENA